MSNLIRQKLIVAIDGQIVRNTYKHKYLLFLPEGELHEISLLFANYLIRSRQHKAVYLGQSVPFSDLRSVYDIHKPDFLLTAVTSVPGPEEVQAYIDKLSEAFPQTRILISGFQVVSKRLTVPANVSIIAQISELLKVLGENHI